ncbi:MAG: YncE family protein [Nitrososphaerales archaeon]
MSQAITSTLAATILIIGIILVGTAVGLTLLLDNNGVTSNQHGGSSTTSSSISSVQSSGSLSSSYTTSESSSSTGAYQSSTSSSQSSSEISSSYSMTQTTTSSSSSFSYADEQLQIKSTLGFSDNQFAFDSSNGYMYGIFTEPAPVATGGGNESGDYTVSVLSDSGLVANISTPCVSCYYRSETVSGGLITSLQYDYLAQIAYNPITKLVYVFELYQNAKNGSADTLVRVINGSTDSIVSNFELKQITPDGVASDTTTSNIYLYVIGSSTPSLVVLDGVTGTIRTTITQGLVSRSGSGAIAYDPLNNDIYTSDGQVISAATYSVTNVSGVAGQTDYNLVTVNEANNYVYYGWTSVVYCCTPRNAALQLVNGSSNAISPYSVNVQNSSGSVDSQILYDSHNGNIYVDSLSTNGTSTISVISYETNSVAQSITVGANVQVLGYDEHYDLFYGIDGQGNTLIVSLS